MKQWIGWVLFALSLWVTYQGWENSRPTPETESMAQALVGKDGKLQTIEANFIERRYEWDTDGGPMTVVCRRDYLFMGHWTCRTT